jgi:uncharacterized protein
VLAVDTNVLIYAADADSQFHAPCRDWLERQRVRPDAWYTTWGILYEFLRVTTHPRVMRRPWSAPAAWEFVSALLASPGLALLVPTQRHADVVGKSPAICCTTHTRLFSCVSTGSDESALGIPISTNFRS